MPLYEYECDACGRRFEKILKFSDDPLTVCELCGKGPVHKLQSSPAIQFKGSGWYITDYAKKGSAPAGESGTSTNKESSDKPAEKKEKPAEKKSETTTAKTDTSSKDA
jgi:putative FmdB family regulatory protein